MIFCGHGCIHLWRYESLDVLTKTLVDRYRLKDADLTQLQFFISEDLTLQADYSEWSKKIYEGEHTLHTNETKYQEVLHIRKNLPGKCIEIIPEHKIYAILPKVQYRNLNLNWEPMRLHINFDNEYLNYLVFTPDPKSGKFVMEYNQKNNNLVYGGLTYQCQEGCGERLLLFDEIHDSTKAVNERTLPGNSFEDNHFPWELIAAGLGLYLILSATKN
ncbi:MAG TPA: hypothetical protein PKI62_13605 [bacterium]|nr:hypothetical protein [bacterium]HPR89329.1 hypothetical protein [bacterium]